VVDVGIEIMRRRSTDRRNALANRKDHGTMAQSPWRQRP
jgi:hypothetical protein